VGQNQLTGWKDIADFFGTSVRSAMRWEEARRLPVRRLPGGAKDSVFAFRDELEHWRLSNPGRTDGDAAPVLEREGPPPRSHRRRLLAGGSILVLAGLAACVIWIVGWPGRVQPQAGPDPRAHAVRPQASGEPAPVILPFVQLDISRPDGWKATLRVPDGGGAQIGPSPDFPALILRPRVVPAGLMLEVARADGKSVKDRGRASQPLLLLLDRNVTVQLRQPFPFSVRWTSGEPSPR
jgi:hypothetical protein